MATPSIAANAYASLAKLTDPSGLTKGASEATGGQSFGALWARAGIQRITWDVFLDSGFECFACAPE